jgi:peptide/nickel transport system substrate-binding protein
MRRLRRSAVTSVALGVVAMLVLSGTAMAQDESPAAQEKVTFSVGLDTDITSLNPFNLCCGGDYEYLELVYDLGIGFSREDLTPAPRIITEWTPSEDSMTWTLKVRDDVVWHDGTPMTAEDVAFTFNFISQRRLPFFRDYFPFSPTFEVIDDTTIEWQSPQPTFAPEVPPYVMILPEHIWGELDQGDDDREIRQAVKEFENDPPIGTGPYKFVEWRRDQFMRFEANPDYWGGTPAAIDEILIRIYPSQEAMVQALRTGEIDFAESINATLFNTLQDDPNITTHVADAGCWGNIAYNFGGQADTATNHPAIQDLTVRQAVAHAVDRELIVDRVYQGTAEVGYSILTPGKNAAWYNPIPEEYRYPYDIDEANRLLDEAGYLDTDDDGVREMPDGGEPLEFEFMTITDVDGSVDTGRLFQGFLDDIGISVVFNTVDQNKAYDLWFTGEWDVYVWDWCPDPDPDFMLSVFTTDQCLSWSDGCYSNPEYDAMYEAQRNELDQDARKEIVSEMQEFIARELPVMSLNYWSDLQAYRSDRWEGFRPSPNTETGLLLFGYSTTDSYLELTQVGADTGGGGGSSNPGLPAWVWIAIVAGIVAIVAGVTLARRRGEAEEEA